MSRAVEQRQQERTRSLVETPATHSPPKTDPQLAAYLDGDPDEEFEVARHTALDTLRESDCVALWLQAIKRDIEDYYNTDVNHGQLYPNLDTLAEKGLVEKGTIDRRTNSYELTERGRRELETRRDWEAQYVDLTG